jgi:lysophospholipase L1-like esterase
MRIPNLHYRFAIFLMAASATVPLHAQTKDLGLAITHIQQSDPTPMLPIPPIASNVTFAPANPSLPTIFIVGDSTSVGWGPYFENFFDKDKVNIVLAGAAGRSSRTYITEGIWDRVRSQIRPHDIVLIQFGHNDPALLNDTSRARGSIRGTGDQTEEIDNQLTKKHEVVHTFGWYLRQFVQDAKAKGATPIIMSLTPHNVWNGDKMNPDPIGYAAWSADIASQERADYVDLNANMSHRYSQLGQQKTLELFAPHDKIHLTKVGWQLDALWTLESLEYLADKPVDAFISAQGKKALPPPSK